MSTVLAEAPAKPQRTAVARDRSINEIISAARKRPNGVKGAVIPGLATSLLLWASFTPVDCGSLAWIALVPLLQLIRVPRLGLRNYVGITVAGCAFTFPLLQWMRLGDESMYLAWFALAGYLALYFPAFIALGRVACRSWGLPLWVAAPVLWTGLELLRAHLFTGFAWYLLGHSQYRWVEMIQVSDLVGAYGVSFVVMMANAALAMFVPLAWLDRFGLIAPDERDIAQSSLPTRRQLVTATAVAVTVAAASLAYGFARTKASSFESGPRVALIQGNFTTSLKHDPQAWNEIFSKHRTMTGLTVVHQPDLIVWPESMFREPLFLADKSLSDADLEGLVEGLPVERWRHQGVQDALLRMAHETNAALAIGIDAFLAGRKSYEHFNSTVFVTPEKGIEDRYDKLHRVPFGEYIPLRDVLPFLQALTPFGDGFGIAAGAGVHVFSLKQWRLLPLICFEDTVPHLVRSMLRSAAEEKPADVMVNLTNDGWFHGSSELDQHLITAQFRCVENRKPMVRAVNTGISAFIDGNGQVRDPDVVIDLDAMLSRETKPRNTIRDPRTGRYHKEWNAAFVGTVPLDNRFSLYGVTGDVFAGLCATLCLLTALGGLWQRWAKRAVVPADAVGGL